MINQIKSDSVGTVHTTKEHGEFKILIMHTVPLTV